jgi:hypothetical protein
MLVGSAGESMKLEVNQIRNKMLYSMPERRWTEIKVYDYRFAEI